MKGDYPLLGFELRLNSKYRLCGVPTLVKIPSENVSAIKKLAVQDFNEGAKFNGSGHYGVNEKINNV